VSGMRKSRHSRRKLPTRRSHTALALGRPYRCSQSSHTHSLQAHVQVLGNVTDSRFRCADFLRSTAVPSARSKAMPRQSPGNHDLTLHLAEDSPAAKRRECPKCTDRTSLETLLVGRAAGPNRPTQGEDLQRRDRRWTVVSSGRATLTVRRENILPDRSFRSSNELRVAVSEDRRHH